MVILCIWGILFDNGISNPVYHTILLLAIMIGMEPRYRLHGGGWGVHRCLNCGRVLELETAKESSHDFQRLDVQYHDRCQNQKSQE